MPQVWGPGLHLKIPFWQIAKLFNAQILEYTIRKNFDYTSNREALGDAPIVTTAKDGKQISVEGSVLFRIDKANAPELWENIGENLVSKIVRPISRSRISALLSSFSIDEIASNRTQVESMLKDELNQYFSEKGIICEGVLLSEVGVVSNKGELKQVIHEAENQ